MADRPLLFRVFRRVRSRPTGTSAASVDWIRRKIRGTVQVSLSGSCASELPRVSSRQHYKSYLCRFCVLSIHSEYGRGNYISHYPTLVVSPFMLAPKSVDIIEEHGHLELHIKPAFTCLICQTSQTIVQKKVEIETNSNSTGWSYLGVLDVIALLQMRIGCPWLVK